MSMNLHLTCKSNVITFVVAYGPTGTTVFNTQEQKDAFSTDLDNAVFIDANAKIGERQGEEDCKVIGAYVRVTRVSNSK